MPDVDKYSRLARLSSVKKANTTDAIRKLQINYTEYHNPVKPNLTHTTMAIWLLLTVNVVERRISRLLAPTMAVNMPSWTFQLWLLAS